MSQGGIGPGRLVAVVGPSGAGKDSIIRAARDLLVGDPALVFPRRVITRAADVHEDHIPVSREEFLKAKAAGFFALSWEAHGRCYGVAREVDAVIRGGATVILNLSRTSIPLLRQRYDNLLIVTISVEPERLAERLVRRSRESQEEIQSRIARAVEGEMTDTDLVKVDNNGSLQEAVRSFLSTIASHLTANANPGRCREAPVR